MEAYKVWADLSIKGNAHKKLEDFAKLTKKAAKAMADLNKIMMPFNKHLSNMAFNLAELNPALSKLSTTFVRLSTNTNSSKKSFSDFNKGLSTATNRAQSLINKTNSLAKSMGNVGASAAVAGAHLERMKGGRVGENIEQGGKKGGMLGTYGKLGLLGLARSNIVAMGIAGAAYEAYSFGKKSFESASEFESKIGQLQARGFKQNQISDIRKFVTSQNIPGVSYNEMLSAYSNALMATQDPNQAKFLAPILAKGQFAANIFYHGMNEKQQEELVRFAEFRGKGNAQRTAQSLGVGLQMMALSGGTIKPNQLAQFMRYGGGAVSKLTDASLLALEPILQMRGGAKSGTALQTLSLQFSKGQMGKYQALSLQSLGMLGPVELDKNGRPIGSKFGAFKYSKQLHEAPFEFLIGKYLPALKKQGITDPEKIEDRIMFDFGRTSGQILNSMYENSDKILRTLVAQGQLAPGSELYNIALQKPGGAQGRLMAAWENLKTVFGELEQPAIINGMNKLSFLLENITKALKLMSQYRIENIAKGVQPGALPAQANKLLSSGLLTPGVGSSPLSLIIPIYIAGKHIRDEVINLISYELNKGGVAHGPSNTNIVSTMPQVPLNSLGTGYTG